ncbi:sensor domain-containing diguanylate cyclase [Thaumasiovibrio subtropicus]|uniref:sensor domain-containing diguanylate cyclase n=1 Tax=Thaumasiovibrio subtropicus TaxID=1891207 RepID=UPI000B34E3C3|nr:diguanylate cyclase [Thaumasiovibrio subtropicus]
MVLGSQSIKRRLTIYILVCSALFTAITIAVQFVVEYHRETEAIEGQLDNHVNSTKGPLAEALWDLDFEQMQALLEGLHTVPFVCNIELQGKDGTHFLLTDEHGVGPERIKYPLYYNSRELGYVSIAIDHNEIKDKMVEKLLIVGVTNFIKTVVLLLFIFFLVSRVVTSPLTRLFESVSTIAGGSLRKVKVPRELLEKNDEIGILAGSVIDLQQQARDAFAKQLWVQRELRFHQSRLQRTVRERTEELQRQSKVNKILAEMSLDIITHDSKQADRIVCDAIAPLGGYLNVDRISLVEFDDQFARYRHSWRADGTDNPLEEGYDVSRLAFLKRRLLSMEPIVINDIRDLEEIAPEEYQLLESQHIASIAAFPLIDGTKVFGLLTAVHVYEPQAWEEDVISILTRFASAVSELHIHEKNRQAMSHLQDELIEANERLQVIAETDELTGLVNRRPFKRELEVALYAHGNQPQLISLLMIDIDHFKRYNDIYGHVQGDIALRYVARTLSQVLSPNGHMVARIGGEEFAAILTDLTREEVALLGQRLCDDVVELGIPHQGSREHKVLSVSIGAVIIEVGLGDAPSVSEVMELADGALYRAKHEGRNKLVVDDQSQDTNFAPETMQ